VNDLVYQLAGAIKDTALAMEFEAEGSGAPALREHSKRCAHMNDVLKQRAARYSAAKAAIDSLQIDDFEPALAACAAVAVDPPRNDANEDAHHIVQDFAKSLWKVHHGSEQMPEQKRAAGDASQRRSKKARGDAADEVGDSQAPAADSEDELEVGVAEKLTTCPITTSLLEDPVMNPACKHTFSRRALMDYIKKYETGAGNKRVPLPACPQHGCTAKIDKNKLVIDEEAAYAVKEFQRNEKAKRKAGAVDL
jgi:SUMO ligase MMS21 Smc5/6 complex component